MKLLLLLSFFCVFFLSWRTAEAASETEATFHLRSLFLYDHERNSLWRNDLHSHLRSDEQIPVIEGTLRVSPAGMLRDDWYSNGPIPDWTDRGTILLFAELASNAYQPRGANGWYQVPGFGEAEYAEPFGWDFDNHLRGYIFSNMDSQVVMAIKGTDLPWITATGSNDAAQDWLMFSCCGESSSLHGSCGCDAPSNSSSQVRVCRLPCMQDCLYQRSHQYYQAALEVFETMTEEYPEADYFITGHSLGAALASMVASTVGYPAVGFESPPERGYSWLAGFDWSDEDLGYLPIFHFGNDGDPIFLGDNQCTTCAAGGVPISTKCHLGYRCVWRTNDWVNVLVYHQISKVIQMLQTSAIPLPECYPDYECTDCNSWIWQL